jgi:hypothetical protein
MGKATQVLQRQDGSEVRIVVEEFWGLGLSRSLDVRVHRRESAEHEWQLTSNRPHPKWREMSVDEYVARGRSEQLRTVSWGEIMKVGAKELPPN